MTVYFTDLAQSEIDRLDAEAYSYFLSHGVLDDLEEEEHLHILRNIAEFDL